VFKFIHDTAMKLSAGFPDMSLRLFLQAAMVADKCSFELISYEFMTQALVCYEDEINDSKRQFLSLNYIISTLLMLTCFDQEHYENLGQRMTTHSAKLLKKTDQCRALYNCTHLYWQGSDDNPGHRDAKRVLACLQRSLKIANVCMGHQVHLFVEILNKYLYFFDRGVPSVTVKYVNGLFALVDEHITNLDDSETSLVARAHYWNTMQHIKFKKSIEEDAAAERYATVTINPKWGL